MTDNNDTKIFGEGMERVAVRPITDKIYWITHCLGDLAGDIYKEYFASLPNAEEYSSDRIVDYPFSAFLILDEKPLLIDTIGPKQQTAVLEAVQYVLGERQLAYIWISHIELPHAGNPPPHSNGFIPTPNWSRWRGATIMHCIAWKTPCKLRPVTQSNWGSIRWRW